MHVALVPRVHASLLQPDGTKLLFGDSKLAGAEAAKRLFVRLRVQRQLELMNPKQAFTPKIVKMFVKDSAPFLRLCILSQPAKGCKGQNGRKTGKVRTLTFFIKNGTLIQNFQALSSL